MNNNNLKFPSEILEPSIIIHSLNNVSFFLKIKPYLDTNGTKKSYFNDEKYQTIFNIISKWYDKFNKFPTQKELLIVNEKLNKNDNELKFLIDTIINKVYTESPEDVDINFIEQETQKFIQENRVYEAMMLSQIDVENGNYDIIAERMREAITVNFDKDLGVSIRDVEKGITLLNELGAETSISTGIPSLDNVLDGGWRGKEIYVFAATPGIGKCLRYDVKVKVFYEFNGVTIIEDIRIGDLFKKLNITNQGEYIPKNKLKVKTTAGFKEVKALRKTQPNPEWVIKTESGREAVFTDKHKLEVKKSDIFDVGRYWENIDTIKIGQEVNTENGWEKVTECYFNGNYSEMYDLEVDSIKSFYANGFNSHNTALLGNFAINAFLDGKKVLVYTFETADRRLLSRYYSNLIEMTKKEILLNEESAKEKINNIINETSGDLILKEYPANTVNSNGLLAHINDLKMYKQWKPDLIIVDYILIMLANDKSMSSDNSYKFYKTVTEELRNIGKMLDVPVLTATQINRQGQDDKGGTKAITTSKDISESRGIYDTADFFATINQPARDREAGKVMIYVDKNRNGDKGQKIKLNIDYEHMKFTEV